MGICLDEHLAQRRRPQWRLKKKIYRKENHKKVMMMIMMMMMMMMMLLLLLFVNGNSLITFSKQIAVYKLKAEKITFFLLSLVLIIIIVINISVGRSLTMHIFCFMLIDYAWITLSPCFYWLVLSSKITTFCYFAKFCAGSTPEKVNKNTRTLPDFLSFPLS